MVRRKVGLHGTNAVSWFPWGLFTGARASVLGCTLLVGCSEQGTSQEDGFRRQELALEQPEGPSGQEQPSSSPIKPTVEPAVESDGPTATAVTVVWYEQGDEKVGTRFPVLVANTSSEIQSVELLLTGATPSNQIIEQPFLNLALAPNEKRVVSIAVDDLPVQSTVHASALSVTARYGKYGSEPTNPPLLTFTESLMLTFESNFKTATARKMREQIRFDSNVPDKMAHLLARGEVLIKHPSSAAFAKAAVDNPESGQGPTLILSQLEPRLDLEENVQHFPDTELTQGDR